MDQKQVGPAAVSRARAGEGANGNAVGLPHLQLAALDPLTRSQLSRRQMLTAGEKHRTKTKTTKQIESRLPKSLADEVSSQLHSLYGATVISFPSGAQRQGQPRLPPGLQRGWLPQPQVERKNGESLRRFPVLGLELNLLYPFRYHPSLGMSN